MVKTKLPKPRIWSKNKCVTGFSKFIRNRDGQCMYPGCGETEGLQNSHYIGRRTNATTFDPDNCITLCRKHHYGDKFIGYEFQKQIKELHGYDGKYTLFMKKHLGTKRFQELMARSRTSIPLTRAIIGCMELLKN